MHAHGHAERRRPESAAPDSVHKGAARAPRAGVLQRELRVTGQTMRTGGGP